VKGTRGTTKPQPVDPKQVKSFLASAFKKLAAAEKTADIDVDAAYELAYGAMTKASLALMLSHGQRPRAIPGHHQVIIGFCQQHLPVPDKNIFAMFDRMRRKRIQTFYDVALVGEQELQDALMTAREYLNLVRVELDRRHP
jgi:uncharacterized protein (UPF0332 family)